MNYTQHPLSAAFPSMSEEERLTLRDSIENIGVQSPIVIFEGMVLDGWHRYTLSRELGMRCPEAPLGDVDPVDFVRAANKARRHLSAGQLALAEVSLHEWRGSGRHESNVAAAATLEIASNAKMAEAAGVSPRTIRSAKVVHAQAAPEVKAAAKLGKVSIERAAEIARLPVEQQPEALETPVAPKAKSKAAPVADAAVKSAIDPREAQIASLLDQIANLRRDLEEATADNVSMGAVFDANDKLAAAIAENKQLRAQIRTLEDRVRGLQAEKNEAVRAAKSWQRKAGAIA